MIEVKYISFLGNNLFQYALGYILAKELGFQLQASPLEGFPNTKIKLEGKKFDEPVKTLEGHIIDLEAIIRNKNPRKIILHGYFQQYKYYEPYRDKIKKLFVCDHKPEDAYSPDKEDVIIAIRRKDYIRYNSVEPFSYFQDAIEKVQPKKIYICSDATPETDPFMAKFQKYDAVFYNGKGLNDFAFILKFNKIIISQSTFSWWAAYLSNAEQIIVPIPLTGFWSKERPDINLTVNEKRYTYLQIREKYKKTLEEKWKWK